MSQIDLSMRRAEDIQAEIERLNGGIAACRALIADQGAEARVSFRSTPWSAHFYGSILDQLQAVAPRGQAGTLCTDIIASNQGKIDQLEAELARREVAAPPGSLPFRAAVPSGSLPFRESELHPAVWVAVGAALVWWISKR